MSNNQESNQNQQLTDEEQQYLLKCYDEYCKSLSDITPPMNSHQETYSSFARSIITTNLGQATLMAVAKTSQVHSNLEDRWWIIVHSQIHFILSDQS